MTTAEMVQFFGLSVPCVPGTKFNLQAICTDNDFSFGGEMVEEAPPPPGAKARGCGGCQSDAAKIALLEKLCGEYSALELTQLAKALFH